MDSIPDIINGIIEHHGVKGQKWGVRRKRSQSTSTAPSTPAKKPEHASVQPATHKPPETKPASSATTHATVHADPHKELKDRITELKLIDEHNRLAYNVQNAELKRVVDQMNLQKQYKELTKKPPSLGKRFVNNLIEGASKEVGKVLITALIKSPLEAKLGKVGAKTTKDTVDTVTKAVKPFKPSMSSKATKQAYKKTKKGTGNLPAFTMSDEATENDSDNVLEFTHEENSIGKSAVESILARNS